MRSSSLLSSEARRCSSQTGFERNQVTGRFSECLKTGIYYALRVWGSLLCKLAILPPGPILADPLNTPTVTSPISFCDVSLRAANPPRSPLGKSGPRRGPGPVLPKSSIKILLQGQNNPAVWRASKGPCTCPVKFRSQG